MATLPFGLAAYRQKRSGPRGTVAARPCPVLRDFVRRSLKCLLTGPAT